MKKTSSAINKSMSNNLYALKIIYDSDRIRIPASLIKNSIYYFTWVYSSAFLLRKIVYGLENNSDIKEVLKYIAVIGLLYVGMNIIKCFIEQVIEPLSNTKLYYYIYEKVYKKSTSLGLEYFEDSDFYNQYTKALNSGNNYFSDSLNSLTGIITGIVASVFISYSIYSIDRILLIFVVFPLIGNFFLGRKLNAYFYKKYLENVPNDKVYNFVNRIMYLVDYAKEIRISNIFSVINDEYESATKNKVEINSKYAKPLAITIFVKTTVTFTAIFEGTLCYASYIGLTHHKITLSQVTVLSSVMVSAVFILTQLFDNMTLFHKSGVFIETIRGFLNYQSRLDELQEGIIPDKEIKEIEFRHVSFGYKDKEIIHDLSFHYYGGEVLALVGHNGAGKTTIIKLLMRFYDPTDGIILLNGIDIREYDIKAYRQLFEAAFQDSKLFAMSIRDNIAIKNGKDDVIDETIIRDALSRVGLSDKVVTLKNGIDSILSKEFDQDGIILSGGETQKVEIARAFAQDAQIKIFDEPSSAFDPIVEHQLFKSIIGEKEKCSLIIISHRLSSTRLADRILVLEQGKLVEYGSFKELMELGGVYANLYRKQAEDYMALSEETFT